MIVILLTEYARHGDENMIKDYVSGQGWEYKKTHEDT